MKNETFEEIGIKGNYGKGKEWFTMNEQRKDDIAVETDNLFEMLVTLFYHFTY